MELDQVYSKAVRRITEETFLEREVGTLAGAMFGQTLSDLRESRSAVSTSKGVKAVVLLRTGQFVGILADDSEANVKTIHLVVSKDQDVVREWLAKLITDSDNTNSIHDNSKLMF